MSIPVDFCPLTNLTSSSFLKYLKFTPSYRPLLSKSEPRALNFNLSLKIYDHVAYWYWPGARPLRWYWSFSPMPPRVFGAAFLKSLPQGVSETFEQAQVSTANHRKNCIRLHKLHVRAASTIVKAVDTEGSQKLTGETHFEDAFLNMVNRVLVVKKGVIVADRIVKFVGSYVKYMNEKGGCVNILNNTIVYTDIT